ncbi:c-type cytochrome [Tuwongella immobilis]|uniref:Cytochrome c domain-containing protein n=1 Tax=Tuwongella immobilis TaxID=692036 RepID=A0A6C2YT37_9BACT|nr:c-type cytochrome [Tuwongella immobilis]VIP04085.1 secreted protein : Hypothetical conserved protein OS=uncultured planctomycete GN=HGMM_F11F07C26 PE=4 SV=1: Cytochrom_C [Tuwongella immobilis]VTS05537.1 secreted protein : Hypothetical conserved protein OS=uncultured planctomycete GN=HGMM_F11F07C26 PE=4 SV=1: Cytochrom_C [Tuwongella immobilis]
MRRFARVGMCLGLGICLGIGITVAGRLATAAPPEKRTEPAAENSAPRAKSPAAERGEQFLTETAYVPAIWGRSAYESLWKHWPNAPREKPADYLAAIFDQYGLPPAPYPNHGLPMGLRQANSLLYRQGVTLDCMICHGGSIFGKSYVGLGNTTLDLQAVMEDFNRAEGRNPKTPYQFCQTRGTNEAGATSVYLLGYRNPDLSLRKFVNLDVNDNLCEDVPAWWLLKKKSTMYYNGGADARSVRSIMQFMMSPLNSRQAFEKAEPQFRDILQFIKSIESPKYPLPVNRELAALGATLFAQNCASCHGTYGDSPTYPNKVISLAKIGTDPTRFNGVTPKFGEAYNASWFAQEATDGAGKGYPAMETAGYQAPPLDGLWATAPYLHNGSCPTVYHVLNSAARPARFTRSFRTTEADYDSVKLGWKVQVLSTPTPKQLPDRERRKIYDTALPGRSNQGHTYGDALTDDERFAIIEYLKTL